MSIIICCYNSSARLPQTLKHLALQKVPYHLPWEIILIDNASTDRTAETARNEWNQYKAVNCDLISLSEPTPGKNFAFNTGVKAAKYEYILTCDDDNWLNPNYVAQVFEIMESDNSIGALGGLAEFEPEQPMNSEIEKFSFYFVNGPQTWASTEHWVYGAGSVYRKRILTDLNNSGWQQVTSGRKGKSLICGEDSEFCFMIFLKGFKVIAKDELTFKHFVPLKRQQINYIVNLSFWQGYSHVLMNSYYPLLNNDIRPIEEIINKWLWGATKNFCKSLMLQVLRKINLWDRLTIDEQIKFNGVYGIWVGLLKNRGRIIEHHKRTKKILNLGDF